jgi:hypothetical protein
MKFNIAIALRIISCLLALTGLLHIRPVFAAVAQNRDNDPPTFSVAAFYLVVASILFSFSFTKTFNKSISRTFVSTSLRVAVVFLGFWTLFGLWIALVRPF